MAITKMHPIKSTLNLAIAYITNEEKDRRKILVSTQLGALLLLPMLVL